MPNFFTRLFSGRSKHHGSQHSLPGDIDQSRTTTASPRASTSLENLSSYQVTPRELDKYKLHKAAWEGNLRKVQKLARPGHLNIKDQQSRTPLHLAVVKGHTEIVKCLVEENAKLDALDNEKRTPLIKAVLSGNQNREHNYEICHALVHGDGDPFINITDRLGKNALHYAIDFGNEKLVRLFLGNQFCDPNAADREHMTPLHLAVKRNSPNIVQLLLSDRREQQADPNIPNHIGQTPVHLAASVGYTEIVRLLLTPNLQEPYDPTILDGHQRTAFQVAKANHQEPCAKLIAEYEENWAKHSPRRLLSTSTNEPASLHAMSTMSLHPASNIQHGQDETSSDDSPSFEASKPSKPLPKTTKGSSDDWSDDNNLSFSKPQPEYHNIASLLKKNPVQPHARAVDKLNKEPSALSSLIKANPVQGDNTKTSLMSSEPSVLGNLVKHNPLQFDTKNTTQSDNESSLVNNLLKNNPVLPVSKTPTASNFGIGPVFDRKDSENTSSISNDKVSKAAHQHIPKVAAAPTQYVNIAQLPTTGSKSWSDDTITATASPVKQLQRTSERWDSSTSEDDAHPESAPAKRVASALQKTLPFATTKIDSNESSSDDDSVETEIRKLDTNKPIANETLAKLGKAPTIEKPGYKVIGLNDMHSPISEESSWTTGSAKANQAMPAQGIKNLVMPMKKDESTWSDSHPTTNVLKDVKKTLDSISSARSKNASQVPVKGIENLVKVANIITPTEEHRAGSPSIVAKFVTSSLTSPNDESLSENTLHGIDHTEDYEQNWKKKPAVPTPAVIKEQNARLGSHSSVKSSFNDRELNELKETIRRLERNQEDTEELKKQLREVEIQKINFEKLYKENDQMLRQIEHKLEQEQADKQRFESTTNNLYSELAHIQRKLQTLENEKDSLTQRYEKLQEEQANYDERLRLAQKNNLHSSMRSSIPDDDADRIQTRHREELRLLSAENDDLHERTKILESDLQLHKDSLDITVRYKIDLEKALEEKTFYQQELSRLQNEKSLIEQERLEYKAKYDGLQEEIHRILSDRSKLEHELTRELQDHMHEKQQSSDHLNRYRTQIEQLNIRLHDAETYLSTLKSHSGASVTSKDRNVNPELQSISPRLNQMLPEPTNPERRHRNEHSNLTDQQQRLTPSIIVRSSILPNNQSPEPYPRSVHQRSNNTSAHDSRLQTDKNNERHSTNPVYHTASAYYNGTYSSPPIASDNYLIENSRKMRSDTERVKSELDRLRHEFDKLVSNYEPSFNTYQQQLDIHSQIDSFRQFYEDEFRQRQDMMSKLTPTNQYSSSTRKLSYHQSTPHLNHDYQTWNGRRSDGDYFRERYETPGSMNSYDRHAKTLQPTPIVPRQASSLLTMNTTNNGATSTVKFVRDSNYV